MTGRTFEIQLCLSCGKQAMCFTFHAALHRAYFFSADMAGWHNMRLEFISRHADMTIPVPSNFHLDVLALVQ